MSTFFIQRSRVGDAFYEISEGHLEVTVRPSGVKSKSRVNLRVLDPNYEASSVHFFVVVALALSGAAVLSAIVAAMVRSGSMSGEVFTQVLMLPVTGLVLSLIVAIRFTARLDYFTFNDHWGRPVVRIARERGQRAECDAFVAAMVTHIELEQSSLTAEEKRVIANQLNSEELPGTSARVGVRHWKLSIALGLFAIVVPVLPGIGEFLGPLLFFAVFIACLGAVGFAAASFMGREPGRAWAVIGFVLGLIPPFFY